jgi:hypothetical protein
VHGDVGKGVGRLRTVDAVFRCAGGIRGLHGLRGALAGWMAPAALAPSRCIFSPSRRNSHGSFGLYSRHPVMRSNFEHRYGPIETGENPARALAVLEWAERYDLI